MSVWAYYFKKEITEIMVEIHKFIQFIHNENPLLLTYYEEESDEEEEQEQEQDQDNVQDQPPPVEPYENKYMSKFKQFTNDYSFTWADLKFKQDMIVEIPHKIKTEIIPEIMKQIKFKEDFIKTKTNELIELLQEHSDKDDNFKTELIEWYKTYGLVGLLEKYGTPRNTTYNEELSDMYDEESELYIIINKCNEDLCKLNKELEEYKSKIEFNEPHQLAIIENQAQKLMIEKKLNNLMNNYIIEYAPVGNVVMRYNHHDQTFDYFSNNSIPYRYLETIGRKYVMTYQCKNIFIDMETEVENANKLNEENKNSSKSTSHKIIKNPVSSINQINKKNQMTNKHAPENRNNSTTVVNPINNLDIAVKNSNRYTWKGRFADFKILKSVKKEIINKNLKLSFKDFKNKKHQ
jgi:hypothetical protein